MLKQQQPKPKTAIQVAGSSTVTDQGTKKRKPKSPQKNKQPNITKKAKIIPQATPAFTTSSSHSFVLLNEESIPEQEESENMIIDETEQPIETIDIDSENQNEQNESPNSSSFETPEVVVLDDNDESNATPSSKNSIELSNTTNPTLLRNSLSSTTASDPKPVVLVCKDGKFCIEQQNGTLTAPTRQIIYYESKNKQPLLIQQRVNPDNPNSVIPVVYRLPTGFKTNLPTKQVLVNNSQPVATQVPIVSSADSTSPPLCIVSAVRASQPVSIASAGSKSQPVSIASTASASQPISIISAGSNTIQPVSDVSSTCNMSQLVLVAPANNQTSQTVVLPPQITTQKQPIKIAPSTSNQTQPASIVPATTSAKTLKTKKQSSSTKTKNSPKPSAPKKTEPKKAHSSPKSRGFEPFDFSNCSFEQQIKWINAQKTIEDQKKKLSAMRAKCDQLNAKIKKLTEEKKSAPKNSASKKTEVDQFPIMCNDTQITANQNLPLYIMQKNVLGIAKKYPPRLREFATTLFTLSAEAYEYLKEIYSIALPPVNAIKQWQLPPKPRQKKTPNKKTVSEEIEDAVTQLVSVENATEASDYYEVLYEHPNEVISYAQEEV